MNGCRTVEDIATAVRLRYGLDVDVRRLVVLAASAGLLTESPAQTALARSQFDRLSLTIFELPLGPLLDWIELNAKRLPRFWLLAQAAVGMAGTFAIILLPPRAPSGSLPLVAVVIACALSLLAHETGHCLVALEKGVKAISLTVAIYAGVMPVVYVRLPGIFRLTPANRLRVWSAGCACNGVIAVSAAALSRLTSQESVFFWTYVARWNVALIVVSLIPFLPTDGYFILSTMLRTHNLRSRAYQSARAMLSGSFTELEWKAVIFLLSGFATISIGLFSSASQWGKWVERTGALPLWGWIVPFLVFAFTWILRSAAVRINEWRWRRSSKANELARVRL
jgi:putative peptide zinc metalloprotease protein